MALPIKLPIRRQHGGPAAVATVCPSTRTRDADMTVSSAGVCYSARHSALTVPGRPCFDVLPSPCRHELGQGPTIQQAQRLLGKDANWQRTAQTLQKTLGRVRAPAWPAPREQDTPQPSLATATTSSGSQAVHVLATHSVPLAGGGSKLQTKDRDPHGRVPPMSVPS